MTKNGKYVTKNGKKSRLAACRENKEVKKNNKINKIKILLKIRGGGTGIALYMVGLAITPPEREEKK